MTITEYILKDIKTPGAYVPSGIVVGLAVCLLANLLYMIFAAPDMDKHGKTNRNGKMDSSIDKNFTHRFKPLCKTLTAYRSILIFLIALYIYVILQHSFFSRPPDSRTAVNFSLFGTWGESAQSKAYVIENILMFIPYSILLPMLIKRLRRHGWLCIITAMMLSILLETAQYLTSRGFCQLDDVIMNTLGAIFGWVILNIVLIIAGHIIRRKR